MENICKYWSFSGKYLYKWHTFPNLVESEKARSGIYNGKYL